MTKTWNKRQATAIARVQRIYMEADAGSVEWNDYYAEVETLAIKLSTSREETFAIVEDGPCMW